MAENYIIEGTVSELTKQRVKPFRFTAHHNEINDNAKYDVTITDNGSICFCITGTDGYAIKQNETRYNVFCSVDLKESKIDTHSLILRQDFSFPVSQEYENLLLQALTHRTKIRFSIGKDELQKIVEKTSDDTVVLSDISISLFNN